MNIRLNSGLKKYRALSVNVTRVLAGATNDRIGLNVIQATVNSKTRLEECIKLNKTRNKPGFNGNLLRNVVKDTPIFSGGASAASAQSSMNICIPTP